MSKLFDRSEPHRLMCDPSVQGRLLVRAGTYGLGIVGYIGTILFFSQWMSDLRLPLWRHCTLFLMDVVYWIPGMLVFVPLLAVDLLRESNRFVSPVRRLRSQLQALSRGEEGEPLPSHEEEYWNEIATSFNQLREEVLQHRQPPRENSATGEFCSVEQPELLAEAPSEGGDVAGV